MDEPKTCPECGEDLVEGVPHECEEADGLEEETEEEEAAA